MKYIQKLIEYSERNSIYRETRSLLYTFDEREKDDDFHISHEYSFPDRQTDWKIIQIFFERDNYINFGHFLNKLTISNFSLESKLKPS